MTQDVNVVLLNFSHKGREMVVENEDGSFTILINAKLSSTSQLEAYHHAMEHIANYDFQKENVQSIEFTAHKLTIPDDAERIPANKYIEQIKALRKQRRKTQKKLRELEADKAFFEKMGVGLDTFARGEHFKLYGNDL